MATKNEISAELRLTPVLSASATKRLKGQVDAIGKQLSKGGSLAKNFADLGREIPKSLEGIEKSSGYKKLSALGKEAALETRAEIEKILPTYKKLTKAAKQFELTQTQSGKLAKAAALTNEEFSAQTPKKQAADRALRDKAQQEYKANNAAFKQLEALNKEYIKLGSNKLGPAVEKFNARLTDQGDILKGVAAATNKVTTAKGEAAKSTKREQKQAKEQVKLIEAESKALKQRTAAVQKFKTANDKLKVATATTNLAPGTLSKRQAGALTATKELEKAQQKVLETSRLTQAQRAKEEVTLGKIRTKVGQIEKQQDDVRQKVTDTNAVRKQESEITKAQAREATRARELSSRAQRRETIRLGQEVRAQQLSKFGTVSGANLGSADYGTLTKGMAAEAKRTTDAIGKLTAASERSAASQKKYAPHILRANAALREQSRAMSQLKNEYSSAHSPLSQMTRLMRQFFRYALGFGALYQVLNAVRALIAGVIDLDTQLRSIQAIIGATDDQMGSLEATIKRVAVTTKFTTREISVAARVLGQAGVAAAELPSALSAAADFAAGTESSLEVAADLLTTMRNVFKELDDVSIADQLAKAVNISKLTANDLKSILSLSAQVSESYNLSSAQYLSAVTTLRNAGLKASTVATGLRQGLIEIFNPDSKTLKALKDRYEEIGENLNATAVKAKFFGFSRTDNPLISALTELKRLGFADEAQKKFQRSLDVRATNAIVALIKNLDDLKSAEQRLTFGRAAAEAADIQMRSLANSVKNLGAAITVLGDSLFGSAISPLEQAADATTAWIQKLVELDAELKSLGQSGVLDIIGGGLLGGAFGAGAGKGFKGKIVGGILGAATGGAVSFGAQKTGTGESAGSGLASSAVTFATIAVGSKIAEAVVGFFKGGITPKNGAGTTYDTSSKITASAKAGTTAGRKSVLGLLKGLGRFVGPVGLFFLAVQGLFFVFELLQSDLSKQFGLATKKLEAARSSAEVARNRVQTATDQIEEYDVDAAAEGLSGEGKTAGGIVNLQNQLSEYRGELAALIGKEIPDALSDQIEEELAVYRNLTPSNREKFLGGEGALADLFRGREFESIDKDLFNLSQSATGIPKAISGLIGDITTQLVRANDTVTKAVIAGKNVSADVSNLLAIQDEELVNAIIVQRAAAGALEAGLLRDGNDLTLEEKVGLIRQISQNTANTNKRRRAGSKKIQDDALVATAIAKIELISTTNNIESIPVLIAGLKSEIELAGVDILDEIIVQLRKRVVSLKEEIGDEVKNAGVYSPTEDSSSIVSAFRGPGAGRNRQRVARGTSLKFFEELLAGTEETAEQVRVAANELALEKIRADQANIRTAVEGFRDVDNYKANEALKELSISSPNSNTAKAYRELVRLSALTEKQLEQELKYAFQIGTELTEISHKVNKELQNVSDSYLAATAKFGGDGAFQRRLDKLGEAHTAIDLEREADEIQRQIDSLAQGRNKEGLVKLVGVSSHLFDDLIAKRREQYLALIEQLQKESDAADPRAGGTSLNANPQTVFAKTKKIEETTAKLRSVESEILARKVKETERYEEAQRKIRDSLAKLDAKVAEEQLLAAAEANDFSGFREVLDQIDEINARKLELYKEELLAKGADLTTSEGRELFDKQIAAQEKLLADTVVNAPLFVEKLKVMTDALEKEAQRISNLSVSSGDIEADARAARDGRVGDVRRGQSAANQVRSTATSVAGVQADLEELRAKRGETELANELAITEEAAKESGIALGEYDRKIRDAEDSLIKAKQAAAGARQELALLGSTVAEEIVDGFNLQSFAEGLRDAEFEAKNLARTISDDLVAAVDDVGEAFADAIIDGDDFGEAFKAIINDISREIFTTLIQSGLRQTLLSIIPDPSATASGGGILSSIGGAVGGFFKGGSSPEAEGETAEGEDSGETKLATGSNLLALGAKGLLTAASSTLQSALRMFLGIGQQAVANATLTSAAGLLSASAAQLTGAALALQTSSATSNFKIPFPGAATGGIFSGAGIARYAGGGIIRGPGTGTSDSIAGLHMNGGKSRPIAVSNGEAILNAKAVSLLGDDFVHALNSQKFQGFNAGGLLAAAKNSTGKYKPGSASGNSGTSTPTEERPVNVMNFFDRDELADEMINSPSGTKAILNVVGRNPGKFKGLL
jgi:TP901 family phage tail tape measure protein